MPFGDLSQTKSPSVTEGVFDFHLVVPTNGIISPACVTDQPGEKTPRDWLD
jgi:hypothetical protein